MVWSASLHSHVVSPSIFHVVYAATHLCTKYVVAHPFNKVPDAPLAKASPGLYISLWGID